ncbi:hypothetical protein [Pseudoprimorskyibacter insulae]|uniref:Uncharacterized protein n=1 Tax=Pseudoprimorskyibacter insulae TaxID=1695997 RepID=A0A2R8AXT7_9RHOB|nr:hypothetical protein [Pseudoprimorskyibacter insulae]SPF80679.1 hypothetical protein PRI8871_02490 [Pseudoprimorskyibacter insulae]
MGVLEDLADGLAADTMKAMAKLGDERLYEEVAKALGASSTTLEEAFLTSMRFRLAERRGRKFLENKVREALKAQKAEKAADDGN